MKFDLLYCFHFIYDVCKNFLGSQESATVDEARAVLLAVKKAVDLGIYSIVVGDSQKVVSALLWLADRFHHKRSFIPLEVDPSLLLSKVRPNVKWFEYNLIRWSHGPSSTFEKWKHFRVLLFFLPSIVARYKWSQTPWPCLPPLFFFIFFLFLSFSLVVFLVFIKGKERH
jgi:hypothetical protein